MYSPIYTLSSPQFSHSLVRIFRLPVRTTCFVHWPCHGSVCYTSAFNRERPVRIPRRSL